jgi:excisionase family DNA binding protein
MSGTLLTPRDASTVLKVSMSTIRTYIRNGRLPARRIRGSRLLRIREEDLDALLQPPAEVEGGGRDQ